MSIVDPSNIRLETSGIYVAGATGSYATKSRQRFAWDFDYSGISGTVTFRLQVDNGSLTYTDVGTTTLLTMDSTGQPVNLVRSARVRAEHATLGNSSWIDLPFTTSGPIPDGPHFPVVVNLRAALVSDTSVLLSWEYSNNQTSAVTFSAVSSDGGAFADAEVEGLETSCTLTGLTAGKTYEFDVATFSLSALTVSTVTSIGGDEVAAYAVMAAPDDTAPISGPTTLRLQVGVPAAANWSYIGSGQATLWTLQGAPAGIGAILTPTVDNRLGQLDGAPTVGGIFAASVNVLSVIGHVRSASTYPVKICVTGEGPGSCLSWFHDSPDRVDLQPAARSRRVYSYAQPSSGSDPIAALRLTRGDTQRVHIIPREDGGLITTVPTVLGLTIRMRDRRDGMLLMGAYSTSPSSETINGHTVYYLDLVAHPFLEQIFENLNRNSLAEPSANSLECEAELTMKLTGGAQRTFAPFPAIIMQDEDR